MTSIKARTSADYDWLNERVDRFTLGCPDNHLPADSPSMCTHRQQNDPFAFAPNINAILFLPVGRPLNRQSQLVQVTVIPITRLAASCTLQPETLLVPA
jgi:hypothetical protein